MAETKPLCEKCSKPMHEGECAETESESMAGSAQAPLMRKQTEGLSEAAVELKQRLVRQLLETDRDA